MVLAGPEELEFALRLFRDDSLMAKSEARRKKKEHEALTGHSVHMHGWLGVFGRQPFGGRPPGRN